MDPIAEEDVLNFSQPEILNMHSNYLSSLKEIEELKKINMSLQLELRSLKNSFSSINDKTDANEKISDSKLSGLKINGENYDNYWVSNHELNAEMVKRYSRHLLLPKFGFKGQEKVVKSSVLIIGAGGLGSPAALYLAASGVGRIGIVDKDSVDLSNIHRQIIHQESSVGKHKVQSAAESCKRINSSIKIDGFYEGITPNNAIDIISKYDVILDCTDNVGTRYLINDACVIAKKPLVWGAALGLEGQATVFNNEGCLCYRCLFPKPPPQAACQRCSDSGVLGVVPGIIGCIQALETIKIISNLGKTLSSQMLHFDAISTEINIYRLRNKKDDCVVCGAQPQITIHNLNDYDYENFTKGKMDDGPPERLQVVLTSQSVTPEAVKQALVLKKPYVLLDVRTKHEFSISALPGSVNIPLSNLSNSLGQVTELFNLARLEPQQETPEADKESKIGEGCSNFEDSGVPIFVICRRGNDSQLAVQILAREGFKSAVDVTGGLEAWSQTVDSSFPIY